MSFFGRTDFMEQHSAMMTTTMMMIAKTMDAPDSLTHYSDGRSVGAFHWLAFGMMRNRRLRDGPRTTSPRRRKIGWC